MLGPLYLTFAGLLASSIGALVLPSYRRVGRAILLAGATTILVALVLGVFRMLRETGVLPF